MKKLSDSELEIMVRLWEVGKPLSFDEIVQAVDEQQWTESTIRTFLRRIIVKGYIKSEPYGRIKLYSPNVSRDYINRQSQNIINRLYDDSVQNFIAGLYQNNALSKQDLQELKAYLEELLKED